MVVDIQWVFVEGGVCRFGDDGRQRPVTDLWVSATVVARGDRLPVTGVQWMAAVELAASVGGRLPTSLEWEWIAAGPGRRRWPWGEQGWSPERALMDGLAAGPGPVDIPTAGATPEGVLGLAGNVWEWTSTTIHAGGAVIRGGSFASRPLYGRTTFLGGAPIECASPGIGVRVVTDVAPC